MDKHLSGKPGKVPKPDLRTTVDRDLLERVRYEARRRGISVSAIVERALDHYLYILEGSTDREHDTGASPAKLAHRREIFYTTQE